MTHDKLAESMDHGETTLFSLFGEDWTYHEFHAAILGASLGFICGERGIAVGTLKREPWYALGGFALAYLLGKHYDPRNHA